MGTLELASPWSRRYFPADLRPDVERLVPSGHVLRVVAKSSPTVWTLVLLRGTTEVRRRRVYGRDLPHICRSTLMAWSQVAA